MHPLRNSYIRLNSLGLPQRQSNPGILVEKTVALILVTSSLKFAEGAETVRPNEPQLFANAIYKFMVSNRLRYAVNRGDFPTQVDRTLGKRASCAG